MNRIYCGPPPDPSDILSRWNLDPVLLVLLCLCIVGVWVGRIVNADYRYPVLN